MKKLLSIILALALFASAFCTISVSAEENADAVHVVVKNGTFNTTDGAPWQGVLLSCLQFFVSSVLCGILAFIFESPSLAQLQDGLIPVLYTGIMSSGVAYTMQILGQRNFNPTIAAMIMSFESVISAIAGYFAYQWGFLTVEQSLSALQIIGCVIMFAAVIFVQLPFDKLKRRTD